MAVLTIAGEKNRVRKNALTFFPLFNTTARNSASGISRTSLPPTIKKVLANDCQYLVSLVKARI